MNGYAGDFLLLVFFLQMKHLVADFFLQNEYMLSGRDKYFHRGRALHVLLHMIGTLAVLLLFSTQIAVIAFLALAEFILHYHIDWAKSAYNHKTGITPDDAVYWQALGIDQALHHATYIAMVFVWMDVPVL